MEVKGVSQGLGVGGLGKERQEIPLPLLGMPYPLFCRGNNQAIISQTQLRALSWDALPSQGPAGHSDQTQVQTGAALVPCQATVIRNLITHSPSDH